MFQGIQRSGVLTPSYEYSAETTAQAEGRIVGLTAAPNPWNAFQIKFWSRTVPGYAFRLTNVHARVAYRFKDVGGKTAAEIEALIPKHAKLKTEVNAAGDPVLWEWSWAERTAQKRPLTVRVRLHAPPTGTRAAPAGSNSASGWTANVEVGRQRLHPSGDFHPAGVYKPRSAHYNTDLADEVHMPIPTPSPLVELAIEVTS